MSEKTTEQPLSHCKNCEKALAPNATYCQECGQKTRTRLLSIQEILSDFWDAVTDIDVRLIHTIIALFSPGKLTKEYFNGRVIRYWTPVRIYLLMAVFFIFSISFLNKKIMKKGEEASSEWVQAIQRDYDIKTLDSLKIPLAKQYKSKQVHHALDTLVSQYKNYLYPYTKQKMDASDTTNTIVDNNGIRRNVLPYLLSEGDSIQIAAFNLPKWNFRGVEIKILKKDFLNLDEDELVEKYKIEGFSHQIIFKQTIKSMKNSVSIFNDFLNRLSIIILILMPFIALILKLLYVRGELIDVVEDVVIEVGNDLYEAAGSKKRLKDTYSVKRKYYYIEHLIFSFHFQAFVFMLFGCMFFYFYFNGTEEKSSIIQLACFLATWIYQFTAMKVVYHQGYIKTFVKMLLLNIFYFMLLAFFMILGLVVSFFLF